MPDDRSPATAVTAVRGHAISFRDDPFHSADALIDIADALIVSENGVITAFGSQLIDWLNHYTFIEEQRFADRAHADDVARIFFDQLLANGTTTAVTFCAVYPESVDAFSEESTRRGTRMIGGRC